MPLTDRLLQRGLHYAVVDEADSVLIDEAVTPLIISGEAPNPEQVESFQQAADLAKELNIDEDYKVDHRFRDIELSVNGKSRLRKLTESMDGVWKGTRRPDELIIQALIAKELYLRDKQYVVDNEKIIIIDEFTGRLMPDRTWRDGLHQAIEAKENVEINLPKDTYARISFQRFFRMYTKLSGMTGTATEARSEFWQIYHMPVVKIPTNRPCIRTNFPSFVLSTETAKWQTIIKEIQNIHKTGRPLLIGTRSVRTSEHLSNLLRAENLDHQVLNAIYHRSEAQIVAQAGQEGKITVATNMAGRGTDIKLGRGVAKLGGLHVIAAEPNDSGRIDRQLYGRGARQGDPGSARGIFSLEDELLSRYSKKLASHLKNRNAHNTGDISSALVNSVLIYARTKADRMALRQRKSVLKTDHWLDEQLGFSGGE
jgi:preprotein translocase subunit SecA